MLNKQLKELWAIRFQKIFNLERDSFYFYRKLIKNNRKLLEDSRAESILREIMHDEIQHARTALKLIQIIEKKKVGRNKKKNAEASRN